jgi:Tol biopolymer transport system component
MSRGRGAEANGPSDFPSLDWSGRHVAFASDASNLVVGDVNGRRDVFVVDRNARRTRLVSRAIDGGPSNGDSDFPVLSGDGRLVVFTSRASNLVSGDRNGMPDVFLHDRAERTTRRVSVSSNGDSADDESGNAGARISANGRCIGFESFATNLVRGDDNRRVDFFLRDEAR